MKRLILIAILALDCLPAVGAIVYPASTNGNNTFYGSNTFTLPPVGNGEYLTNVNVDPDAYAYTSAHGLSGTASNMVHGFVATLKAGGLWPSLVDALILKTNLGAAAMPVSFFNRTSVVANVSYDSFGAVFNGSSSVVVLTNLPDCRTNTMVVVDREPAISKYLVLESAGSVAGLWGSYQYGERVVFNAEYYAPRFTTGGTDSGFSSGLVFNWPGPGGIGSGYGGYEVVDGYRHVVAVGNSSNYLSGWGDGWQEYLNTYAGSYPMGQAWTNLYVGASPASSGYTAYHTGEISAVLVFSGVLNGTQMGVVERALRWLESGNENVIVVGDSTAQTPAPIVNGTSETPHAGWPSVLASSGKWNGNVNFHVLSTSGLDADKWWTGGGGSTYLEGWLTNELVNHGLGGPVTKLSVFVDFGHNDRGVQADSLAVSETAMSNLCNAAKAAGADVWTFTTPYAANGGSMWWSGAQEGIRQQENQWLRSNPGFWDHLVDRDLLFTVNEANNADGVIFATGTLAGVHLAAGGNLRLADAILGQMNGVPIYSPSYTKEGLVASLSSKALFVVTNGPTFWPTNPPMPGAWAMVTSNGFPFMLMSTNGTGGVSPSWTGTNRIGW